MLQNKMNAFHSAGNSVLYVILTICCLEKQHVILTVNATTHADMGTKPQIRQIESLND